MRDCARGRLASGEGWHGGGWRAGQAHLLKLEGAHHGGGEARVDERVDLGVADIKLVPVLIQQLGGVAVHAVVLELERVGRAAQALQRSGVEGLGSGDAPLTQGPAARQQVWPA